MPKCAAMISFGMAVPASIRSTYLKATPIRSAHSLMLQTEISRCMAFMTTPDSTRSSKIVRYIWIGR